MNQTPPATHPRQSVPEPRNTNEKGMARFQVAAALIDSPLLIVWRSNARIVFSNTAGIRALAALCGTRTNGRCLHDALLPDPLSAQIFSSAVKAGQGRMRDLLVPLPLVPSQQTWCRLSLESFVDDDGENPAR